MAALTSYAIAQNLNANLHGDALSPPAQWYLALYSTAQDEAETAVECADANYARQPIDFNAESGGISTNNGTVTFPALDSSFSMAASGLCDAISGGHCWIFDNNNPHSFIAGDEPTLLNGTGIVSAT